MKKEIREKLNPVANVIPAPEPGSTKRHVGHGSRIKCGMTKSPQNHLSVSVAKGPYVLEPAVPKNVQAQHVDQARLKRRVGRPALSSVEGSTRRQAQPDWNGEPTNRLPSRIRREPFVSFVVKKETHRKDYHSRRSYNVTEKARALSVSAPPFGLSSGSKTA